MSMMWPYCACCSRCGHVALDVAMLLMAVCLFLVLLDRNIGSRRHTLSLLVKLTPSKDFSTIGNPNVHFDLETTSELTKRMFLEDELKLATREGLAVAALQGCV